VREKNELATSIDGECRLLIADDCEGVISIADCNVEQGNFLCADHKQCVAAELVCDRVKDCTDGSDEIRALCAAKETACSSHHDCQQGCLPDSTGSRPECFCRRGYLRDQTDPHACLDVDECNDGRRVGVCSQRCTNTEGGFECSCADGYFLNKDNSTCSVHDQDATTLIFATKTQVS